MWQFVLEYWPAVLKICTVLGGIGVIVAFLRWAAKQFKEAKEAAEEALKNEITAFETSSRNSVYRTDVGFLRWTPKTGQPNKVESGS